ncbi:MAG: hypothetical protein WCW52_01180 [Elusimicrobiales bacterium]|jgi:hypothetical protein
MIKTAFLIFAFLAPQAGATATTGKSAAPVPGFQAAVDFVKKNKPGNTGAQKAGAVRSFSFTESELNSYITWWIQAQAAGKKNKSMTVKSASICLKDAQTLALTGVASFSAAFLKPLRSDSDSFVMRKLGEYLTMDNSVELECRVSADKGVAVVNTLKLKVKSIPLPDALVQRTLKMIGDKQRPPMDLTKPINLPNGIQKIEILPRKLVLGVKTLKS